MTSFTPFTVSLFHESSNTDFRHQPNGLGAWKFFRASRNTGSWRCHEPASEKKVHTIHFCLEKNDVCTSPSKKACENAPASAFLVACCGVSERTTINGINTLHFESRFSGTTACCRELQFHLGSKVSTMRVEQAIN